jgi:hypothetical protein
MRAQVARRRAINTNLVNPNAARHRFTLRRAVPLGKATEAELATGRARLQSAAAERADELAAAVANASEFKGDPPPSAETTEPPDIIDTDE